VCGWSLGGGAQRCSTDVRLSPANGMRQVESLADSRKTCQEPSERWKEKQVPPPMDPKTRQHECSAQRLSASQRWASPPSLPGRGRHGSTRRSMVAAPAHQRNQKRPRTSSNAVPEPLSQLSVLAHWFHQSIRRGFRGHRGFFLGFMILGSRTCGLWRDRSSEAVRRRRGRTTWPSCWRSSSHTDKPEAQAKGSSIPGMTFACASGL